MAAEKKTSPNVESRLRHNILKMPQEVYAASGIVINGRRLKSFVFTTDLAIIRNCDADAVFAVYPFTPQQAISDAIIKASYIPVFCGVGGGTTHGVRTLNLARDVESQGAMGVVLNSPISDLNLLAVSRVVDIPVKEAVVTYICGFVRCVLTDGFLHTTSERGEGYIAPTSCRGRRSVSRRRGSCCGGCYNP